MIDLLLLAASAFLAATILPVASEAFFVKTIYGASPLKIACALMVATTANTLGSVVNYYLGAFLLRFQTRRWFYFSSSQISKGQHYFCRFGTWSLLFAWLPIVGDALTLVAGILRVRFWLFVLMVGAGKGVRYSMVAYIALEAMSAA